MFGAVETFVRQFGRLLLRSLPEGLRYNVGIEMAASILYGIFQAIALSFLPVVLRRLGADPSLLALYTAQTYLGSILSTFGIIMMRYYPPKLFALVCWLGGRMILVCTFFVVDAGWLLLLTAVFWMLEGLPPPAYAKIIQAIYPRQYRGRALGVIRMGLIGASLIMTPIAGILLDHWGHQILFPIASIFGVASAIVFSFIRVETVQEEQTPQPRPFPQVLSILKENRPFLFFTIGFTFYGTGFLLSIPLFPVVQVDRLGLSYSMVGYLTLTQSICSLLGNFVWGRLIDRRGGVWVVRFNVFLAILVPFFYSWAFNVWWLAPAFIINGILASGIDLGLIMAGIELAGNDNVIEYSAVQTTVIGIRGLLAPFLTVGLLNLGMTDWQICLLGSLLIFCGWLAMRWAVPFKQGAPSYS